MKKGILYSCIVATVLISCSNEKPGNGIIDHAAELQLRDLTEKLTKAETTDDLQTFLQHYDERVISMPEYQLTLEGRQDIEDFYRKIFATQDIKRFQRVSHEYIHLGKSIVEIGTFLKECTDSENDTLRTLHGKYWV